jgi:hypothetical protein
METLARPRTEPGSSVTRSRNAHGFGVTQTRNMASLKEDHTIVQNVLCQTVASVADTWFDLHRF